MVLKIKKLILTAIAAGFVTTNTFAQLPVSLVDNLKPTSPTAWQFLRYTDLPVSEYTGIPNISIPLYEINEDGVKIPLSLTYHATGNKVNQDASWVGLGWDLQIGSIVQTINGKDDFNTDGTYTKWLPDWQGSPVPSQLPYRYNYPFSQDGAGWSNPYPGPTPNAPQPYHAYKIATDYYIPINTNFNIRSLYEFTQPFFDSEPDVFRANFLGHSINFMLDWSTNQLVVLNKKGYKVTRNSDDTWRILVPSGEEFDFQQKTITNSYSTDKIFNSTTGSPNTLSSKIWMLTRIITKNKHQILLNYTSTANSYNSYPFCAQKLYNVVDQGSTMFQGERAAYPSSASFPNVAGNSISTTTATTKEAYLYLNSIIFPKGQVNFNVSSRQDMVGAMKLDSVSIVASQPIKTYKFNYSYFNSGGIGGSGYPINTIVDTIVYNNAISNYRLKLLSLNDNSGAVHTFIYNSTPLPKKNSYATDYWGYYNGQLSNTSLVPNASQFNNAYYTTTFGNNGDNHSANLTYAQAGILQQIKYPTGGTINFSYELNAFNNYYVPDFSTSTNTVSHGNGLRIQAVTYNQADASQSKKEVYTYAIGKAILPINIFRAFPLNTYAEVNGGTASAQLSVHSYNINELNMNGAFSQSMFGSITGVGYDTVSKQQLDLSNNPKGKITSIFYNNPDIVTTCASSFSQLSATLPALKQHDLPDNGSPKSVFYYDQQGVLLKKNVNSYSLSNSAIYYAARLFSYTFLIEYLSIPNSPDPDPYRFYDQHMVGYFPLFDLETLLTSSTETDYFGADSVALTTSNTYDQYNQLATTTKTNSTFNETTQITYPYNNTGIAILNTMTAQNRLSDVVTVNKTSGIHTSPVYFLNRSYAQVGNLIVPSQDVVTTGPSWSVPTTTTYDQFDAGNGNIFQYTKNTLINSFIYDYNKEYVIAEIKNAPYASVAYTSFEADGRGRWKFSGPVLPDNNAPTGKKDYSLSNGSIYRDSLSTAQTFIVSYWSKNGAQTVSGSTSPIQGYTYNGWTYYEHQVANPAAGTITVSGTGTIDELRLYPSNAQMMTYTYEPLVGISSASDAAGKVSYYEYDGAMRLLDIRDQSKNILKAFCYNYAGQPTNCGVNVQYANAPLSVPFMTACGSGYTGSTVNYTVPGGRYTSTMSKADADKQAQDEVTANGQTYANAHGSCAQNISFTLSNSTTSGYQVNFSSGTTSLTYTFSNPGTTTIIVPAGTYTVDVYPTGTYTNHTFTLGSRSPISNVPRTPFNNVNIGPGSTDSSLSIQ